MTAQNPLAGQIVIGSISGETVEIAIPNKNAVVLAADSAVTLQTPGVQKIYNAVNNLLTAIEIPAGRDHGLRQF
ncbi:MAG TPA: hypothetical protein VGM62_11145 [Chthoniobacterales bacterium]